MCGSVSAQCSASSASRVNGRVGCLPEPWQELDHDVERGVLVEVGERRPRPAALDEQRVPGRVVREQADRAVAVPGGERGRLLFCFAVRELELQHRLASVTK